jgi:hypothetical protein
MGYLVESSRIRHSSHNNLSKSVDLMTQPHLSRL